jgi:hypothetical protein
MADKGKGGYKDGSAIAAMVTDGCLGKLTQIPADQWAVILHSALGDSL